MFKLSMRGSGDQRLTAPVGVKICAHDEFISGSVSSAKVHTSSQTVGRTY